MPKVASRTLWTPSNGHPSHRNSEHSSSIGTQAAKKPFTPYATLMSSESLSAALAKFYTSVGTIHKDASAQYGKFADLSGVLSVVNPALAAAGLAITQTFDDDADGRYLVTTLHHGTDKMQSRTKLVTEGGRGNPLHTWGGSVTYQRRFSLLAMLNLAAGIEDTDGDTAVAPAPTPTQPQKKPAPKAAAKPAAKEPEPIADADLAQIIQLIKECEADYRAKFCKAFAVKFKTGNKKVSECITTAEHQQWINQWFSENPQ